MDKECKRQVDELNKLWHVMLTEPKYNEIEKKYENLQELSTTEISVIRIISEKEDVIIKDIVDTLRLPKSTLTSIIDRLEKRNFIVRAISDRDRRSYKLELTEKGRKVQDEHMKFEDEVYGTIILALDTFEEREELLKLIRKISINISKK
ncbi:MarR family transcriptional regulator [Clostridium sp. YIM B02555]|uniref:MarR family winged helix-turn-helix transcriptional regulator n=1 Tax=Clostridium sp. YIM B02555 TaxID=2911968 RepID=UPI001EEE99CB|nr:MarR family transcriptional regulator [Clostridium sp. YIM B02555]